MSGRYSEFEQDALEAIWDAERKYGGPGDPKIQVLAPRQHGKTWRQRCLDNAIERQGHNVIRCKPSEMEPAYADEE